jgi:hypothetical protein
MLTTLDLACGGFPCRKAFDDASPSATRERSGTRSQSVISSVKIISDIADTWQGDRGPRDKWSSGQDHRSG